LNTSLKSRALRSLSIVFGTQVAEQAISFISGIVLARLLIPSDFGLMAMAFVFTGLAGLFAEMGLGAALIQKKNLTSAHLNSVFWFNLGLGIVLALVLFLGSSMVADIYGQSELKFILRCFALIFIITSVAIVPRALFSKNVNFKPGAIAQIVALVASVTVAVSMAAAGYGFKSLVAQQLTYHVTSTIGVLLYNRWHPSLNFSFTALKELLGFSGYVFLDRALKHFSSTLDFFLLGKYFGASPLGQYDKAKSMMIFPLSSLSHSFSAVMFPAFSEIQNQRDKIKEIFLRAINSVSFLTFPSMLGLFSVSREFMLGVLGPQWVDAVAILKIMCFAGMTISIVTLGGSVFMALGKAQLNFQIGLVFRIISILLVGLGTLGGLKGVAIGFTLASFINGGIFLFFVFSLIGINFTEFFKSIRLALINSVIMALAIYLQTFYFTNANLLILLASKVTLGITVYATLSILCKHPAYLSVRTLLLSKLG
jgi:PST family polysaccharide transporter